MFTKSIISLFRRIKRQYLMLRHPRLSIGFGTVIVGKFQLRGQGHVRIGAECRFINVKINTNGVVDIGDGCFLNGAVIVCRQEIKVGPACLISDAYIVDTDFHNIQPELRHDPPGPKTTRPIHIGRNVWIGDHGVVLKGSVIGNDAVVGSNAVVRGNIPARAVCIGNPAKVISQL